MGTSRSRNVLTKQQRIATLAKQATNRSLYSLSYLMDMEWMAEAFRRTRKDGATGVDHQTWHDYAKNLEENLQGLIDRAKSGTYFAPPVRRTYIPKGPGSKEKRPIGIPTLEDKVLQRAVLMLLEPIYEQDFLDCSYGFRPGRSQHQALDYLWRKTMDTGGGWVLTIDIRAFFDTMKHGFLREFIQQRVSDGVIKRLIGKWLNAGVLEEGKINYPEEGSPQGGVISPLASNIYLHYVLDQWFEDEVKPRLLGRGSLVRFADDALIVFTCKEDADRVREVLNKRFGKYGLDLHPDKTRLVDFRRPGVKPGQLKRSDRPSTFQFLGFTHYWGSTRKGGWAVKRKTAKDRLDRGIKKIATWCHENRHKSIKEQHTTLTKKVRGHYNYYGITGNSRSLSQFKLSTVRLWRKWLDRRDQRGSMPWPRFQRILKHLPIPDPRVVKSVYVT